MEAAVKIPETWQGASELGKEGQLLESLWETTTSLEFTTELVANEELVCGKKTDH